MSSCVQGAETHPKSLIYLSVTSLHFNHYVHPAHASQTPLTSILIQTTQHNPKSRYANIQSSHKPRMHSNPSSKEKGGHSRKKSRPQDFDAEYSQHVNFSTIHSQVFHSNPIYAGLRVTGIIVEQISTVQLEGGLVTSERGFFAVYRYMISLTVRLFFFFHGGLFHCPGLSS